MTTGKLVAHEGFAAVHSALTYMAREDIYTHQLHRAMLEAKPVILEKYPSFGACPSTTDINDLNLDVWLREQSRLYGEFLALPRLTIDRHERIDPIPEAAQREASDQNCDSAVAAPSALD